LVAVGEKVTITEAAKRLGVSRPTVYKLIERGMLRAIKNPLYLKGTWVDGDDVDRLKQHD
jgi:transposase